MTSIPPRQVAYLLDIFKSVQAIQSYIAGQTVEEFLTDPKTQDAVLRRFLVAGEAAARLTPETRAEFPKIPFPKIVISPVDSMHLMLLMKDLRALVKG